MLRRCEADRDGADAELEGDLLCVAEDGVVAIQPACGAKRGMAGKGNFFGGEKDAHLHTTLTLDLGSARKDEGRLAEIGFAGEGLHLVSGEAAGIGEDSQGIAFQWIFGEDVDLCIVVCTVSSRGSCG